MISLISWFRFYRNAKGVWNFMRDQGVALWKKIGVTFACIVTAFYVAWPLDLIPDVLTPAILFIAFLDDFGVVTLCFFILNWIGKTYAEKQLPAYRPTIKLPNR